MKDFLTRMLPVIAVGSIGFTGVLVQAEENAEVTMTNETIVETVDDSSAVNIIMDGEVIQADEVYVILEEGTDNLLINGGVVDVTGGSTFDYDGTGVINGGTVIANGQQVDSLPSQFMGGHGGKGGKDRQGKKEKKY